MLRLFGPDPGRSMAVAESGDQPTSAAKREGRLVGRHAPPPRILTVPSRYGMNPLLDPVDEPLMDEPLQGGLARILVASVRDDVRGVNAN